ncbi:MAG: phosphoribosyl-AMP cyclohydrolase [Proteobacteria bacterium]|nr:phosphoribosyl-AMP cyclohydrolase [Pseudomonadota bacterium]
MTIKLDFSKFDGLLPVVTQDFSSNEVLMVAFMNEDAWEMTLASGKATYFSRSRKKLWVKGGTSGHEQIVKEIRIDCDNDTVLLKVVQKGDAACHEGYRSCFYRKVENGKAEIVETPVFDPREVYKK